jgi:hypothetical protein
VETKCIINLSDQDFAIIQSETAAAMKQWDDKKPVYAHTRTHAENTRIGYMSEMAVAYFLGVPYKLERDRTNDDGDVAGYQVKGTAHAGGWMNTRDDMPKGIYIGCRIIDFDTVELVGWSTSRLMRRKLYWNNDPKMKRPCYSMRPDQMYDIQTLPATKQLIDQRNQI